ncbi:hypothetical protein PIB30_048237 [Stylosanthes scabra]|uniref:Uncharacterized protein n=1 Tax=Stylosanthes scabra TaxID=79078 RepID=A0ABU6WH24_9FABA|nr:hypothetical protein [Stylosanthes scabra]
MAAANEIERLGPLLMGMFVVHWVNSGAPSESESSLPESVAMLVYAVKSMVTLECVECEHQIVCAQGGLVSPVQMRRPRQLVAVSLCHAAARLWFLGHLLSFCPTIYGMLPSYPYITVATQIYLGLLGVMKRCGGCCRG